MVYDLIIVSIRHHFIYDIYETIPGTFPGFIVLGPLKSFTGKVIGVYHRLNDNEDKWIVSLNGESICSEDILDAINFQEQYFMGELYTL